MLNPLAKICLPTQITEMSHQDAAIRYRTYSSIEQKEIYHEFTEKKCDRRKGLKMPFPPAIFLPLDLGLGMGLLLQNMQNIVGSYMNASCHMSGKLEG